MVGRKPQVDKKQEEDIDNELMKIMLCDADGMLLGVKLVKNEVLIGTMTVSPIRI